MKISVANQPRRRLQQICFVALAASSALFFDGHPVQAQTAYTDAGTTSQFSTSITPTITGSTSALAGDTLTFTNSSSSTQTDDLIYALNFNALTFSNSGALILNQGAGTTITMGSTTGGAGPTVTLNNPGSVNNNLNLVLASNTSFLGSGFAIFGGVISGAGSLNQNGTGRLILTNSTNIFTGGTNISAGTIALGNDFDGTQNNSALGTGSVNITNGGGLRLGGTGGNTTVTYTLANAITLNNGTIFGVDGAQHLSGSLAIGAGGGTLQANYGGRDIFVDGQLTGSGTLTLLNGPNGGAVRLTNNTNTISGTVNINGTVSVEATNALASAAVVTTNANVPNNTNGNGKLKFNNGITSATFGSLGGSGDFTLNNNLGAGVTLTVGGNNASTTLTAYIDGNGGLVKNGTGTLTLDRQFNGSAFTGNVVVNGGAISVTRSGADNGSQSGLGNATVAGRTITVNAGASLNFGINNIFGNQNAPAATLPTIVLNGGTLSSNSYTTVGPLNLSNAATVTQSTNNTGSYQGLALRGGVTVTDATTSNIGATGTAGYHLGANTAFSVASGGGLNVTAPLINQSGDFGNVAGALTKSGTGTMLLTAVSTYTGATTVSGGTLRVDSAGSTTARLAGTVGIVLNTGGTLLLANTTGVASSDRINNAATVTLAGGTLNLGRQSEGLAGTTGIGALTLTATSTLDFGATPGANLIQFSGLGTHTAGTILQVTDWEGNAGSANGTDRLLFAGTSNTAFTSLYGQNDVSFNGTPGYAVSGDLGGYFEVYGLAVVPEPSTWIIALLNLGILGYSQRRWVLRPKLNSAVGKLQGTRIEVTRISFQTLSYSCASSVLSSARLIHRVARSTDVAEAHGPGFGFRRKRTGVESTALTSRSLAR